MDLQETYNTVVEHLRRQGRRAVARTGECVYLAPDGGRCAVGALIPDGHPALSCARAVPDLLEEFPDLRELIAPTQAHLDLLISLQIVHEDPRSWMSSGLSADGWRRLRNIAHAFHLDDRVTLPQVGAGLLWAEA